MIDKGKWSARISTRGEVVLDSSDFTHDVQLLIRGDFSDIHEKLLYAQDLAARLNATMVNQRGEEVEG